MYPSMPASKQLCSTPGIALAVSAIMGTCRVVPGDFEGGVGEGDGEADGVLLLKEGVWGGVEVGVGGGEVIFGGLSLLRIILVATYPSIIGI